MKKFLETLKNIWKIEDLRQRILITMLFVAIYRFGSFVVLPGINPAMLDKLQSQTAGGLMSLLDMFLRLESCLTSLLLSLCSSLLSLYLISRRCSVRVRVAARRL